MARIKSVDQRPRLCLRNHGLCLRENLFPSCQKSCSNIWSRLCFQRTTTNPMSHQDCWKNHGYPLAFLQPAMANLIMMTCVNVGAALGECSVCGGSVVAGVGCLVASCFTTSGCLGGGGSVGGVGCLVASRFITGGCEGCLCCGGRGVRGGPFGVAAKSTSCLSCCRRCRCQSSDFADCADCGVAVSVVG